MIRLLVMDVDGTLTNGKIYIASSGELFKAFDVKDGFAIANILPQYNITPIIITGRFSHIVEQRCKELGITAVFQGVSDKKETLIKYCADINIDLSQVAYIGDDINDLESMKICSLCGCPSDAVDEIKKQCEFISKKPGGDGAVREFIEWIVERGQN